MKTASEMIAEMQQASFEVTIFVHPAGRFGAGTLAIWIDGKSKEGDKVQLRVEHAEHTFDQAMDLAYTKFRRFVGAAAEFDGRFLIEGKVGVVIDDEIKF